MANVATAQSPLPIEYGHNGAGNSFIIPVIVTMDTTGADLTIYTPAATNFAAIVGIKYSEASAHSLIFKSGSTTLVTLEQAANTVVNHGVGQGIYLAGLAKGDALKINAGTAAVSSILFYVMEFNQLTIR